MIRGQFPKGSFPGWRTMTAAQRYNARADKIWEAAKDAKTRFNASSRGPVASAVAQGERESAPGYDPTCVFCQSGEEPGHEH